MLSPPLGPRAPARGDFCCSPAGSGYAGWKARAGSGPPPRARLMRNRRLLLLPGLLLLLGAAPPALEGPPPELGGRSFRAWVADLNDPDLLVREEAVEVLGKAGRSARAALGPLRALLAGPDHTLRTRAALAV